MTYPDENSVCDIRKCKRCIESVLSDPDCEGCTNKITVDIWDELKPGR